MVGAVISEPEGAFDAGGHRAYVFLASDRSATVVIDGDSGAVLEVVFHDLLPGPGTTLEPESAARTAAAAFLDAHGIRHAPTPARTTLARVAGTAAYQVSFGADPSEPGRSDLALAVDAASGRVFAFADMRSALALAVPLLGRDVAERLAVAAIPTPGEQVTSADLTIGFTATGEQTSSLAIGLGVPQPEATDVFAHGAYVIVDAMTGAVTIEKRS